MYNLNNNDDNIPYECRIYHIRYNVINEQQDADQINLIKNNSNVESYVISEIENEENDKANHRHVTIRLKIKRPESTVRKEMIKYKYKNHEIYCKGKYKNSSLEKLLTYTVKSGIYLDNWDEDIYHKIVNRDDYEQKEEQKRIDANKLKIKKLRENLKQIRLGNIDWFLEYEPRYLLSAEFNRALVWAQKDAKDPLTFLQNYYIIGKSRSGKSSAVRFLTEPFRLYTKNKSRDSWDGYFSDIFRYVLIDELDTAEALLSIGGLEGLKLMLDYQPFDVKMMYSNRNLKIRPKMIFICGNTPVKQLFNDDKHGKGRINVKQAIIEPLQNRAHMLTTQEFHNIFGIRLDKKINRIVFDFKGMVEKRTLPSFEHFWDELITKFNEHYIYWEQHGEDGYLEWQKEQQGVNKNLAEIKKRRTGMNQVAQQIINHAKLYHGFENFNEYKLPSSVNKDVLE